MWQVMNKTLNNIHNTRNTHYLSLSNIALEIFLLISLLSHHCHYQWHHIHHARFDHIHRDPIWAPDAAIHYPGHIAALFDV